MAGWLLRAIVMENVAARAEGHALDLPAAPDYRLEKEIKNVITVLAKTCHYWMGHIWPPQQYEVAQLFESIAEQSPLVVPAASNEDAGVDGPQAVSARMAEGIERETGLACSGPRYIGWLGVDCTNVRAAVWMMRMMVVSNVLSRREGTVLFVPVNPVQDPVGDRVANTVNGIYRLAQDKGLFLCT
jgi:hypothetical protein